MRTSKAHIECESCDYFAIGFPGQVCIECGCRMTYDVDFLNADVIADGIEFRLEETNENTPGD